MNVPLPPLHPRRRILLTIHDSTGFYSIVAVLALGGFLFSLSGLRVTWTIPQYMDYVWVPAILMLLTGFLITSCSVRIIRRLILKIQENLDTGEGLPL